MQNPLRNRFSITQITTLLLPFLAPTLLTTPASAQSNVTITGIASSVSNIICQNNCTPRSIAFDPNIQSVNSLTSIALVAPITVVQGAHSHPLLRRIAPGKNSFYLAGDWGKDGHGQRKGDLGLAEIGAGHNFGPLQINLSFGQTWAEQKLSQGGKAKAEGSYLMLETLFQVTNSLWATFGTYAHRGDANIQRGYTDFFNVPQISSGNPDTKAWGMRARLDWENALQFSGGGLTPYADLSYSTLGVEGYSEKGGFFPVDFNRRNEKIAEFRLGLNASRPLFNTVRWLTTLEGVHRFEKSGSRTTGQAFGSAFDVAGQNYKTNWIRGGLGITANIGSGIASIMLNATSSGETANAWLAASYQISF